MFAISFGLHREALLLAEHFALFLIQSKKRKKKTVVIWSHPYWFIGFSPSVVIVQGDCDTPY